MHQSFECRSYYENDDCKCYYCTRLSEIEEIKNDFKNKNKKYPIEYIGKLLVEIEELKCNISDKDYINRSLLRSLQEDKENSILLKKQYEDYLSNMKIEYQSLLESNPHLPFLNSIKIREEIIQKLQEENRKLYAYIENVLNKKEEKHD